MKISRISTPQVNQIPYVIFQQTKSQFFYQSLDLFSVSWEIILLYFFSWKFISYWLKYHIFRLATARSKVQQILHVIFGTKSQFFFKISTTLQCRDT